jgi:endonuclease/exonuclease/phosphatase family metal-dependent hydrolase
MKKGRMNVLRITGGFILLPVIVVLLFLLGLTIFYDKLPSDEVFEIKKKTTRTVSDTNELSILTWNIGYGGLGKEMDFFYEGGSRVRPEKEEFRKYMAGITRFLGTQDSIDFVFIQEADWFSKRSYFQDEVVEIKKVLNKSFFVVAKNYDCPYVPLPIREPMGRVVSGIVMFSKYEPIQVERKGFGTKFPWPKQLFFLQRCFLVSRFNLKNGKELFLINTHNSTFDKEGELRIKELSILKRHMVSEYLKGNYVIAGGDWNCNPVGFSKENILSGDRVKQVDPSIISDYLPGWKFAFDATLPTNRDVDAPYQKGKTKTTIIDFFVLSPNVELISAKTFELGFEFSDHQPVEIKIRMNKID